MATDEQIRARNDALDNLKQAVDDYYDHEHQRLVDETTFLKSVLRGRTGSERLQRSNTAEASAIVNSDITSYLAGV